ncbi:MAG: ferrous iron transporter B [Planctomycetaceae bacterium]|nr:ferrous iron transporter B [Planctomycetaceae bacterium]
MTSPNLLPVLPDIPAGNRRSESKTVALVGNPNTGKTSLFNRLTGLRAKTANYPGITVDLRTGRLRLPAGHVTLIDLPGLYSLDALSPEEHVARGLLRGESSAAAAPDVVVLVVDATHLARNLCLAGEVLELNHPTVVALNLIDAADAASIKIDIDSLATELGCPVIPVSARTGRGIDELKRVVGEMLDVPSPLASRTSCIAGCHGCTFSARYEWAERVCGEIAHVPQTHDQRTAAIDRYLTNPVLGTLAFIALMLGVFYLIFSLADVPMTLIDEGFGRLADLAEAWIPTDAAHPWLWIPAVGGLTMVLFAIGYRIADIRWSWRSSTAAALTAVLVAFLPAEDLRSLVVDGVIGGVGGILVFLPQICILFFFICLLEDSGYMARAAFVMERLMRRVGLPGKAFVPMISAHACAIPGIMAARVIEDWRDRLVTILVLPLLTCSARLPVYAMVAALLFSDAPAKGALVFVGAYLLGITAALLTALGLKKSILRGDAVPLVIELPPYRMPSLRNALLTVVDRALVFVRNAGTVILMISVILWALATYPKLPEEGLSAAGAEKLASIRAAEDAADDDTAAALAVEADQLLAQEGLAYSAAGRLGRLVEPIFDPLGFDWQMNVGVISSFAAREVVVSTLAIMYGIGEEAAEERTTLVETLRRQQRPDGTPVFTTATCLSFLTFYVLAMQCLPTQAVTRRETGTWKWAFFQLGYMTLLAYSVSLLVYQTAAALGYA